ncbi:amino acid ABC transporter substrate-binding protein [Prochlorococcus sp. MIT 1300]|uniref:amino acid ABC transporter substrate-binding protein n=1 Tax=Prochlorococcus sp. MIT 1300 TaxID=3096218 RepID=UPI002A75AFDE|nr:amino acid ABC transporter substrate-binding protein [Prochlorococcus sp. MIT 1300]
MNIKLFSLLVGLLFTGTGCATLEAGRTSRLDIIQRRGELNCGISGKISGFSYLHKDGSYKGFDVDICKAMAAAFLGNSALVNFRPLTAPERFTALRTGEVDLLSRNTTINLSRDSKGGNGVTFAPIVFHDGQGLMVRKSSGIRTIGQLRNSFICVGSGTTTEQNLNDTFQEKGIKYKPIKYQDASQVTQGYLQKRCKAMTSDRSQLAAAKAGFPSKERGKHIILSDMISKEPLAPASLGGDEKLSDAIRWVIYALLAAEEYGINKNNIQDKLIQAESDKSLSSLRRLLGIDGKLGSKLGLSDNFVVKIISSTGNYGEIYDRNLGPMSNVSIPRSRNNLYTNGGLLFAPPLK